VICVNIHDRSTSVQQKLNIFAAVNAGVALMNLTRLRDLNLEKLSSEYYLKYKSGIDFLNSADQGILNVIFHFQPEKLYVLPCHYNYRSSHWYI